MDNRDKIINMCLKSIEDATVVMAEQLLDIGVSANGVFVEYWPAHDGGVVSIQAWNGEKQEAITDIMKKRSILMKRF